MAEAGTKVSLGCGRISACVKAKELAKLTKFSTVARANSTKVGSCEAILDSVTWRAAMMDSDSMEMPICADTVGICADGMSESEEGVDFDEDSAVRRATLKIAEGLALVRAPRYSQLGVEAVPAIIIASGSSRLFLSCEFNSCRLIDTNKTVKAIHNAALCTK